MCDFWNSFNSFLGGNIPNIIVKILEASGYENTTSLIGMNDKEIIEIQNFVRKNLRSLVEKSPQYSTYSPFIFLPGHKKLLLIIGKKAEEYDKAQKKKPDSNPIYNDATPIMKELMRSMEANLNVTPTGRRYSEVCKDYAMYVYMLSGKAAYEVLCNNLPLPQAATVCKYQLGKCGFS